MAGNYCPLCGKPIAVTDLNLQEGVGLCRACGQLSRLSDIAENDASDSSALNQPPAGCTWGQYSPQGYMVRASSRSAGAALGLAALCLFWNGIVSVFLLIALAGLYTNLIGPLPGWFPIPESENGPIRLGMSLFLCVFLTPFILVGTGMVVALLMAIFGRVELIVDSGRGLVRRGIGPFNWTSRFDATKVKRISTKPAWMQNEGGAKKYVIQIEADRMVRFGSMLPDDRRAWMLAALRNVLQPHYRNTASQPIAR